MALVALGLLTLGGLLAERAAAEPAICSEYPSLPQCDGTADAGGNGGGAENPIAGGAGDEPGIPGAGGPTASDGGRGTSGALPFTGYPLTPLILVLLALLVAGLTARGWLALRARISPSSDLAT